MVARTGTCVWLRLLVLVDDRRELSPWVGGCGTWRSRGGCGGHV